MPATTSLGVLLAGVGVVWVGKEGLSYRLRSQASTVSLALLNTAVAVQ